MSGSANERPDRAHQPPAAASESTEGGADELAGMVADAGDATGHGGDATSDRTRSAPNRLDDSADDRSNTPTYPPNYSKGEAGTAHQRVNQPHPHRSGSSAGTRNHPPDPGTDIPGEGDDRTHRPAEQMADTRQHSANRTRPQASRANQRRKRSRDRSYDRSDDSRDTVAEPTNEAEQEATSLPDGNDDTAPSPSSGPADRSGHPPRRHREPTPHTTDGDRAGASPGSTGYEDAADDTADATGDLLNRGGDCSYSASQCDAETTGESSDRAYDRSAELTEASSNSQQWTRQTTPHPSGR